MLRIYKKSIYKDVKWILILIVFNFIVSLILFTTFNSNSHFAINYNPDFNVNPILKDKLNLNQKLKQDQSLEHLSFEYQKLLLPRIAILTLSKLQQSYTHLSLSNKFEYAQQHNYDLIVHYSAATKDINLPVWYNLDMIEDTIKKKQYEWIWWIDFDSLITNKEIKLETIIAEALNMTTKEHAQNIDMILTVDCNGLNIGSMIFRSTPLLIPFLETVRQCIKNTLQHQQICIQDLLNMHISSELKVNNRYIRIPQWKINAYPKEILCYDEKEMSWQNGMFVVHFPGAWAYVDGNDPVGQLMETYQKFIV